MSDTSDGDGWWLASDGKWYPPPPQPAARALAAGMERATVTPAADTESTMSRMAKPDTVRKGVHAALGALESSGLAKVDRESGEVKVKKLGLAKAALRPGQTLRKAMNGAAADLVRGDKLAEVDQRQEPASEGSKMLLAPELAELGHEAIQTSSRIGEWLRARFGDVRLNSVGHFVVPPRDTREPFMVGVDDTDHGTVVDLHSPFLLQVPGSREMAEIVAMNVKLTTLGSVRLVPEDEAGSFYSLELRHQVHALMLTQQWLYLYADLLPRLSTELAATLQPALGGVRVPAGA